MSLYHFSVNFTNMPTKRPPIVAIMGHVDHGKTTLLDYIRKTNIASREAGGITQSIGAYEIVHSGQKITFIDTPGHEAFTKMRAYGAKIADLAILVIAAEDGVKPQTLDALKHIQEAKLPFVVAINKIDKPNADVERTKGDLSKHGVYLEGFGGNVSWHAISAKNGEGVSDLLDLILLAAEMENLTYDPDGQTQGIVLSARSDPQRGLSVGVVLKDGTLDVGQMITTGDASGRVRMLEDFTRKKATLLIPSAPALIIGFETLPEIGEVFFAGKELAYISKLACEILKEKNIPLPKDCVPGAEPEGEELAIVVKADESASLEALLDLIQKISTNEKSRIKILQSSVGDIHESDVKTAENGGSLIVSFRSKPDTAARNLAQAKHITILSSQIIYELEQELQKYLHSATSREQRSLEILAVFGQAKGKERVVGGRVIFGSVKNQESFEIWHEKKLMGTGKILNLQSGRKDIAEALQGQEVGLLVESEAPIKIGNKLIFPTE